MKFIYSNRIKRVESFEFLFKQKQRIDQIDENINWWQRIISRRFFDFFKMKFNVEKFDLNLTETKFIRVKRLKIIKWTTEKFSMLFFLNKKDETKRVERTFFHLSVEIIANRTTSTHPKIPILFNEKKEILWKYVSSDFVHRWSLSRRICFDLSNVMIMSPLMTFAEHRTYSQRNSRSWSKLFRNSSHLFNEEKTFKRTNWLFSFHFDDTHVRQENLRSNSFLFLSFSLFEWKADRISDFRLIFSLRQMTWRVKNMRNGQSFFNDWREMYEGRIRLKRHSFTDGRGYVERKLYTYMMIVISQPIESNVDNDGVECIAD